MTKIVPLKARGSRAELRRALEAQVPVRISRESIDDGWIHGYVVGLGSELCLLAEVGDAMRFDGYLVIAVTDINAVEEDPSREFVEKALLLRDEKLIVPADFRLDDWASAAQSASALAPLLALNMLDSEGEVSYIGRLLGIEGDALVMREVDPNAHWYPDSGAYEFSAIGSLGFGSGYMEVLWQVAGAPTEPLAPSGPSTGSVH